jgi:signal transduction histidine kinase
LDRNLVDSGKMIAHFIDGNILELIEPGFENLYPVEKIINVMNDLKQREQFSKIMILSEEAEVIISTDANFKIGDIPELKLVDLTEIKIAFDGTSVVSVIYQTDIGLFKTGYIPVKNDIGNVTGVLCLETQVEFISVLYSLKTILFFTGVFSILFVILFVLLLIKLQNRILSLQNYLIKKDNFSRLGKLSAILAHELRNPIQIVAGNLEMLSENERTQEKKDMIDSILDELVRMNSSIQSFLNISTEDKEKIENINLNETINEIINIYKPKLDKSKINLIFNPDENLPDIILQKDRCKQVLINLIQNSIEAMETGGDLVINTVIEDGKVILTIKDTGTGIDKKIRNKVFEPFFSTKSSGIGIGLAVVKKILDENKAEISFESNKGQGTTFKIIFNPNSLPPGHEY